MIFNDARLLDCVSYGSEFAMAFNTQIVQLRSGAERRNANWASPLGQYSVNYNALKEQDHLLVLRAHRASMGSLIPFRFKDWTDFTATQEEIGIGDGTVAQSFQLIKTYTFGTIDFSRLITKPVSATVTVYVDGIEVSATVDYSTGLVLVDADEDGVVTWSGEFDVPVRFDDDQLDVRPLARNGAGFILSSDVSLTEIRV